MTGITNRQMFMIILVTLTCYSVIVLPKTIAQSAGNGGWLTLLVTALVFGIAAVIIVTLNSLFQGKMLFDYAPQIVGKAVTYIIVVFYILYFMLILVYLIINETKLLQADFFPQTPRWAFPLIGIPVLCFISNKGMTNIGRLAEIIGLVYLFTTVLVHIIMTTQGDFRRIQPFFNASEINNYLKSLKQTILPFIGLEVLLAIPLNGSEARKTAFFSVIFVGIFYVLIVESSIMKVGLNSIVNYKAPLIVAIRDTSPEYLDILARLDVLLLTVGFSSFFLGTSIIISVISEYLYRIFKSIKRFHIIFAVGIATFILFLIFNTMTKFNIFVEQGITYLGILASLLIPVILLISAKIRKVSVRGKNNAL